MNKTTHAELSAAADIAQILGRGHGKDNGALRLSEAEWHEGFNIAEELHDKNRKPNAMERATAWLAKRQAEVEAYQEYEDAVLADAACAHTRACAHENSATTADGNGTFCRDCGETLA